jgi:uncharacterized membrane protein YfcA
VDLKIGIIVGIGNVLGAFVGTRLAVSYGPKLARIILMVGLVFSVLKIFGVVKIFAS